MRMRYVGKDAFHVGIPARDLTREDIARLPDRLRRRVEKSGLYAPVKAMKPKEPEHE